MSPVESMLNKEQLVEAIQGCRTGDRYAQNRLYRAFYAWAFSICQRYTHEPEATKECVQDGFFKVFTKIDKYSGDLPFEGWIKRIMINTCIDRYRSKLKELEMVELTEKHDESIVPDILVNADADYLLLLVRRLPPAYQSTFNLFAVEGYEYQEIAEMLGVSLGSVKSNLSKARMHLKKMLLDNKTEDAYERQ